MTTLTITTPCGDQYTLGIVFGDVEQALDHARRTTTGPWEIRQGARIVATGSAKATYSIGPAGAAAAPTERELDEYASRMEIKYGTR